MTTYVDSSVVLRIILGEPDPLVEWERLDPVSSELLRVECLRALERYRIMGAFSDADVAERRGAAVDTIQRFRLVEPGRAILERAAEPFPVYVATLDAVHLATALELRAGDAELDFATHDVKLATAARALGFSVIGA